MSCLNGFCPSFVSITSKSNSENKNNLGLSFPPDTNLPQPICNTPISNIFIAGIGGTGVSTLSGVMIMAARIDGLDGTAVNQTGLSQKMVGSQVKFD